MRVPAPLAQHRRAHVAARRGRGRRARDGGRRAGEATPRSSASTRSVAHRRSRSRSARRARSNSSPSGGRPAWSRSSLIEAYALDVDGNQDLAIAAAARLGNRTHSSTGPGSSRAAVRIPDGARRDHDRRERLPRKMHLRVGSRARPPSSTSPPQVKIGFSGGNPGPPAGPPVQFRVVGIDRRPLDLGVRAASGGVVVLTPAFNAKYKNRIGIYTEALRVQTRNGAADVPASSPRRPASSGAKQQTFDSAESRHRDRRARTTRSTCSRWRCGSSRASRRSRALVAIGIVLTRDIAPASGRASRRYGRSASTRGERVAAIGARAARHRGRRRGCSRASVRSWLHRSSRSGSRRRGRSRRRVARRLGGARDRHRARCARSCSRSRSSRRGATHARRRRSIEPPRGASHASTIVEAAARAGLPPTATNGLRMALEPGRGDTAVPVRSAFAGAAFGSRRDHRGARVRSEPHPPRRDASPLGLDVGPRRPRSATAPHAICIDSPRLRARACARRRGAGRGVQPGHPGRQPPRDRVGLPIAARHDRSGGRRRPGAEPTRRGRARNGDVARAYTSTSVTRCTVADLAGISRVHGRRPHRAPLARGAAAVGRRRIVHRVGI